MNTGVTRVRTEANAILDQLERVIVGKRAVLERAVTALLCEGHVLLEDVPGVGKTVLARILAGLWALMDAEAARQGWTLPTEQWRAVLESDIELNAQGLGVWLDRQTRH